MKAKGVTYLTAVSAASETLALLDEVQEAGPRARGHRPRPAVLRRGRGRGRRGHGAHVLTNTVPFNEADETPILQLYLDQMEAVGAGEDKVTTLGVQSFSAGLLFATAADALGADLTREGLVSELRGHPLVGRGWAPHGDRPR